MEKLIFTLMTYIASVSGTFPDQLNGIDQLEVPRYAPIVQFTNKTQLFRMYFQREPEENEFYQVEALQIGPSIYLAEGWDINNVVDQSKLLHELVHYMQEENGLLYDCNGDKERLAYYIQEKWLMEEQGFSQEDFYKKLNLHPLAMVAAMSCPPSETLAKPGEGGI